MTSLPAEVCGQAEGMRWGLLQLCMVGDRVAAVQGMTQGSQEKQKAADEVHAQLLQVLWMQRQRQQQQQQLQRQRHH